MEDRYKQYVPDKATIDAIAKGDWSRATEDPSFRSGFRRYGAAKLFLVMMIYSLQARLNRDPALHKICVLAVDPGTMSPYQHGEVYVLDDGAETDLDLGHYERFTDAPLNKDCNLTTGKIYQTIIQKERQGKYKGKTVQATIMDEVSALPVYCLPAPKRRDSHTALVPRMPV